MKLTEINAQVVKDLEHIQKWAKGSAQNMFRQRYTILRQHDLAKTSKTRNETFREALDSIKKGHPDFVPRYDPNYFQL